MVVYYNFTSNFGEYLFKLICKQSVSIYQRQRSAPGASGSNIPGMPQAAPPDMTYFTWFGKFYKHVLKPTGNVCVLFIVNPNSHSGRGTLSWDRGVSVNSHWRGIDFQYCPQDWTYTAGVLPMPVLWHWIIPNLYISLQVEWRCSIHTEFTTFVWGDSDVQVTSMSLAMILHIAGRTHTIPWNHWNIKRQSLSSVSGHYHASPHPITEEVPVPWYPFGNRMWARHVPK